MTNEQIGDVFGKNHSTYNHCIKAVNNLSDTENSYKSDIDDLRLVIGWRLEQVYHRELAKKEVKPLNVLPAATTVGELRAQLAQFPDSMSFGFLNQPMQRLHIIKHDNFEGVAFQ